MNFGPFSVLFLNPMSNIDLCNVVCLAVLLGRNFNIGHYMQSFQPNFVMPAMPIGTIDFYHFTPLSLVLGSQGQCIKKPVGFIFSRAFQLIRLKCDRSNLR